MRRITRSTAITALVAVTTLFASSASAAPPPPATETADDIERRCEAFDFDTSLQVELVDTHLFRNGRPFVAEVVTTDVDVCWVESIEQGWVDPIRSRGGVSVKRDAVGVRASSLTWGFGWTGSSLTGPSTLGLYNAKQGLRIEDRSIDRERFSRIELRYSATFESSISISDSAVPGGNRVVETRSLCLRLDDVAVLRTNDSIDDVNVRGQRQQCQVVDRTVSFD